MMISRKLLVTLASTAFFACGPTAMVDITKTAPGFYDATNANQVEILKTSPPGEFVELGMITTSGFAVSESAKMHNALRMKAAPLGATAVILTEEGVHLYDGDTPVRWATGVAIRMK